jgi:D-xylose 1-dehydrogenase (NADP+, D-xylono-1,5-lactone-forming)
MGNWGILATGRIAHKFAQALAESSSEKVVAVASRDRERANDFAQQYGIANGYGSYAELIDDPAVEFIYNALPNTLHAEWSIAGLRAGKHILCEKPLASNAAEAASMFEVARQEGRWLVEAFMYRFHPQTLRIQELVASGTIGAIKQVQAGFSFTVTDTGNTRLDADLAGGGLMDVGCYPVNFARMLVGTAPKRVGAVATWAASGVDLTLVGTLDYGNGALAMISCGLAGTYHQFARIVGTQGIIEVDNPFTSPANQPTTVRLYRGVNAAEVEHLSIPPVNHYQLEAEGLAALVAAGHTDHGLPEMPLQETLDNMATIDALLLSAREGRMVDL